MALTTALIRALGDSSGWPDAGAVATPVSSRRDGGQGGRRACLDLPQALKPSRKPRVLIVDRFVYAPGRLAALPLPERAPKGSISLDLDVETEVGDEVVGPEGVFASVLVELTLVAKDLRTARALTAQVLRDPPVVVATGSTSGD